MSYIGHDGDPGVNGVNEELAALAEVTRQALADHGFVIIPHSYDLLPTKEPVLWIAGLDNGNRVPGYPDVAVVRVELKGWTVFATIFDDGGIRCDKTLFVDIYDPEAFEKLIANLMIRAEVNGWYGKRAAL